jgi:hypothetical protein
LHGGTQMYVRAEVFLRKMLRWALRTATRDTRCSLLFLASNSCNMSVLC